MLWPALAPGQTTISLRPAAKLPEEAQQVRLADIADIEGDGAGLGETVVIEKVADQTRGGWVKIDVSGVRAALDGRAGGVNWGRISLRGASCTVRFSEPKLSVGKAGDSSRPQEAVAQAVDLSGPATIRAAVAGRLASLYGVEPDRLRLGFDAADTDMLDTLIAGRQIDVAPAGLPSSTRLPVNLTLYQGDQIALARTIQVSALVYRPVLIAAATIERGRTIDEDQVNAVDQWLAPSGKLPPTLEQVVGSTAQKKIAAGETIDPEDVAAPIACKRGDTVYIHCVSGSFVVKVRCRAMGTARDGEMVQLKPENSDEPVTARMSGKGRAVLLASPSPTEDRRIVRADESEQANADLSRPASAHRSPKPTYQRPLRKAVPR